MDQTIIKNCVNCLESVAVNKKYCLCSLCNTARMRELNLLRLKKYYIKNQERLLNYKKDYNMKKNEGKGPIKLGRKRIYNITDEMAVC